MPICFDSKSENWPVYSKWHPNRRRTWMQRAPRLWATTKEPWNRNQDFYIRSHRRRQQQILRDFGELQRQTQVHSRMRTSFSFIATIYWLFHRHYSFIIMIFLSLSLSPLASAGETFSAFRFDHTLTHTCINRQCTTYTIVNCSAAMRGPKKAPYGHTEHLMRTSIKPIAEDPFDRPELKQNRRWWCRSLSQPILLFLSNSVFSFCSFAIYLLGPFNCCTFLLLYFGFTPHAIRFIGGDCRWRPGCHLMISFQAMATTWTYGSRECFRTCGRIFRLLSYSTDGEFGRRETIATKFICYHQERLAKNNTNDDQQLSILQYVWGKNKEQREKRTSSSTTFHNGRLCECATVADAMTKAKPLNTGTDQLFGLCVCLRVIMGACSQNC